MADDNANRQNGITLKAPFDLRATLATMKSAHAEDGNMNVWEKDIKAVEAAIATIEALRAIPAERQTPNPVCDLQTLLEIRDFLQDIVGGAEITDRSRQTAKEFVAVMDTQYAAGWQFPAASDAMRAGPMGDDEWKDQRIASLEAFIAQLKDENARLSSQPETSSKPEVSRITFIERVGEIAGIIIIVCFIWFGGTALAHFISELPPVCMSIGGGCQ